MHHKQRNGLKNIEVFLTIKDIAPICHVVLSHDGKNIVTANIMKQILIYDLITKSCIHTILADSTITCMKLSRESNLLFVGLEDGRLIIITLFNYHVVLSVKIHDGAVNSIDINEDNSILISAGEDQFIKVWNLYFGFRIEHKCLHTLMGHFDGGISVRLANDCTTAVSGGRDKKFIIWNIVSGECKNIFTMHEAPITSVDISSDGKFAISSSMDTTVNRWILKPDISILDRIPYDTKITRAIISYDRNYILSLGEDGFAKIIDLKLGRVCHSIGDIPSNATIAISSDGQYLVSTAAEQIFIWRTEWELIDTDVDSLPDIALPYINNFVSMKTNYSSSKKINYTKQELAILMQNLAYAGFSWIKERDVDKKIKEFIKEI